MKADALVAVGRALVVRGQRRTMPDAGYLMIAAVARAGGARWRVCGETAPVARPTAPPPANSTTARGRRPRRDSCPEPQPMPPEPVPAEDSLSARDIDEINKNSPFQPVFYALDRLRVDAAGPADAQYECRHPRQYPSWVITIEGHCRRARERGIQPRPWGEAGARGQDYLVSLGIPADRLGRSATARSSRSTPATTRPRG